VLPLYQPGSGQDGLYFMEVFGKCVTKLEDYNRPMCLFLFMAFDETFQQEYLNTLVKAVMDEQRCEHRPGYQYMAWIVVGFLADQYKKYQEQRDRHSQALLDSNHPNLGSQAEPSSQPKPIQDCPYFRLLYLAISGESCGRNHARHAIRRQGSDVSSWYRKQSEGCLCDFSLTEDCHCSERSEREKAREARDVRRLEDRVARRLEDRDARRLEDRDRRGWKLKNIFGNSCLGRAFVWP